MVANPVEQDKALLAVNNLVKYYPIRGGFLYRTTAHVKAVDDISFQVRRGETFGLVGESGCGKTTVGRCILRLQPRDRGEVRFENQDLYALNGGQLKRLRKDM